MRFVHRIYVFAIPITQGENVIHMNAPPRSQIALVQQIKFVVSPLNVYAMILLCTLIKINVR